MIMLSRTEILPALEVIEECYDSGRDAGDNVLYSCCSHCWGALSE
jgi:hypothetical protein